VVIKGRARGGPAALAVHLERHDTNERVTVLELRGVTSRDMPGALREMDCMGSGAASVRTLYHAAINTAPDERLTDEQKQRAADRLEKELGFEGQPRIIIEHVKKDREHMHVVFLRIDTDRMVAIPDSHNYRKHEIVARDLEREFGHRAVPGAHIDREGRERPHRTPGHDEMQQAERSGLTPQQAKEQVTRLWHQADSGRAFAASVRAESWVLARGDKRDFVLVDSAGETHSLARRVDGAKAADVRQRMADVDPATLPTVDQAKVLQHEATAGDRSKEKEKTKEPDKGPVILKVPAPIASDPAEPLQPVDLPPRSIPAPVKGATDDRAVESEAHSPSKQTSEPKPAAEKPCAVGPFKRLYTTAATTVQRVYDKARGVFEPKTPPAKAERPGSIAKPAQAKPAPKLTQTQETMRLRRTEAHAADRQASPAIVRPPSTQGEKSSEIERDHTKERKHKLSREEIEMLFERQRRQREHSGPSR
jgi:hypothetical protein